MPTIPLTPYFKQSSPPYADGLNKTSARQISLWRSNEPASLTEVSNVDWSGLTPPLWGISSEAGTRSIVSDATSPISPPSIVQNQYLTGREGGNGGSTSWITGLGLDEIYICQAVRWSANWQGHSTGTNKLCFVTGMTGGSSEVFISMNTQTEQNRIILVNQATGLARIYPRIIEADIVYGDWVIIELYLKMNTDPALADGIAKMWVDGQLITDVSDSQFYNDAGQPGVVNTFKMDSTWGGSGDTVIETMELDTDQTFISGA